MARRVISRPQWIDPETLYSRQEVGARTGLSDDVLSFWIKRGLLVPEKQNGTGKGVHHRFHFSQINIGVILKALRDHFGANIRTLKSLADRMQAATQIFRSTKAPPEDWFTAARLGDQLAQFRQGEEVVVSLLDPEEDYKSDRRAAVSEAEIIASHVQVLDRDADVLLIMKLAERLGRGRSVDAEIAFVTLGIVLNPRYSGDNFWLLYQVNDTWQVRNGSDGSITDRSDVGPAMFLPIYRMVREVWGIPAALRAFDQCARLKAAFKDAGVEATIVLGEDGFRPSVSWVREGDFEKAQAVYDNFFKPGHLKERDGDDFSAYRDPRDYDDIYWTASDGELA